MAEWISGRYRVTAGKLTPFLPAWGKKMKNEEFTALIWYNLFVGEVIVKIAKFWEDSTPPEIILKEFLGGLVWKF